MDKVRIVIVDDSAFSIAFIRNILEENGFEVVGEAGNLDEVKKVVEETKPNLVTMDMTLPGTDGLECTRAVHKIDKNIKVIVVSSMMDEEIIHQARENDVSAYVQKPVDADELVTAINRILATKELYEFLNREYFPVFKEGLLDSANRMTKTRLTFQEEYPFNKEHSSAGLTVIVGIIGKFSGRMLIDMSKETAHKLAAALLRRDSRNADEMMAALSEFANIISGNACSVLNRENKALGLRVAPPSIFYGEEVHISAPEFGTMSVVAETDFGEILLNAGFKRGE